MLEVFYLDVVYVLQWFSNVCFEVFFCMCFRRIFQMFICLRLYVLSVVSIYFNSRSGVARGYIRMFQVFHLFFRHMLQMFHLNVSKVDLGEAYVVAAMCHHGSPCRRGSPRALTGGGVAAACMWARENGAGSGWSLRMHGPVWHLERDG
jgi:hypothetical protein